MLLREHPLVFKESFVNFRIPGPMLASEVEARIQVPYSKWCMRERITNKTLNRIISYGAESGNAPPKVQMMLMEIQKETVALSSEQGSQ